jgi:NAD(P)-dependent dehydrogenase (short-subunit alcohol dehydrogenase family)
MARLEGKIVIVTGAAQGIGATYAKAVANEGANVVVADILDAEPVAREIEATYQDAQALALSTDVSDEAATEGMVAKTVERFGKLDILVTNAAIFGTITPGPFDKISPSDWDALMEVNVKGPWLCAKAAVPEMRKNGYGKIINIAS